MPVCAPVVFSSGPAHAEAPLSQDTVGVHPQHECRAQSVPSRAVLHFARFFALCSGAAASYQAADCITYTKDRETQYTKRIRTTTTTTTTPQGVVLESQSTSWSQMVLPATSPRRGGCGHVVCGVRV